MALASVFYSRSVKVSLGWWTALKQKTNKNTLQFMSLVEFSKSWKKPSVKMASLTQSEVGLLEKKRVLVVSSVN